jgi:tetratricopeptide (TPR) repeat protein
MAMKVVDLSVKQADDRDAPGRDRLGNYWNTLGVAHYRAGNVKEAHAALQKSLDVAEGGECRTKGEDDRYVCEDWLFLAMVNWKLGRKVEARKLYDRAAAWMEEKAPSKELEIHGFRSEAATTLGIDKDE